MFNLAIALLAAFPATTSTTTQPTLDRSAIVQISAGELDDLRREVRMLRVAVARLEAEKQHRTMTALPAKPKALTKIEVGMSKADFDAFLKSHPAYVITEVEQKLDMQTIHFSISEQYQEQVGSSGISSTDRYGRTRAGTAITQRQYETRTRELGRGTVTISKGIVTAFTGRAN